MYIVYTHSTILYIYVYTRMTRIIIMCLHTRSILHRQEPERQFNYKTSEKHSCTNNNNNNRNNILLVLPTAVVARFNVFRPNTFLVSARIMFRFISCDSRAIRTCAASARPNLNISQRCTKTIVDAVIGFSAAPAPFAARTG